MLSDDLPSTANAHAKIVHLLKDYAQRPEVRAFEAKYGPDAFDDYLNGVAVEPVSVCE